MGQKIKEIPVDSYFKNKEINTSISFKLKRFLIKKSVSIETDLNFK